MRPFFPVGARHLVPFLVSCRPCVPSLRGGIPSEGPGRSCSGSLRPTLLLALPTGETFVALSQRSLPHAKMPLQISSPPLYSRALVESCYVRPLALNALRVLRH